MRLNTTLANLELCWRLSVSTPWLSCRSIAKLTKVSVQTSANHRSLGKWMKARCPRLKLYKLPLAEARKVAKRL